METPSSKQQNKISKQTKPNQLRWLIFHPFLSPQYEALDTAAPRVTVGAVNSFMGLTQPERTDRPYQNWGERSSNVYQLYIYVLLGVLAVVLLKACSLLAGCNYMLFLFTVLWSPLPRAQNALGLFSSTSSLFMFSFHTHSDLACGIPA